MRARVARLTSHRPITRQRMAAAMSKDDGLTTAEYAVGTVAAAGLGGVLLKLLTSPEVRDLIWNIVSGAFRTLMG